MDIRKLQRAIVDGLEDVKALDILVFNTEELSPLFERVIIASGNSNRQTKALASSVREAVKAAGLSVMRTEGEDNGEWIIVDCGAAVAHIMQPAIRAYYRLEEIWGGKPVRLKLGGRGAGQGLAKASEGPVDEDDEASEAKPARKSAKAKAPKASKTSTAETAAGKAALQLEAKLEGEKPAIAKPKAARKTSSGSLDGAAAKPAAKQAATKTAPRKTAAKTPTKAPTKTSTKSTTSVQKVVVPATKRETVKLAARKAAAKVARKAPARKSAAKPG